ncbi:MAG: glucosamine-6-phosphate deaminase [Clostridiales bacterium]|nr:glucosamine-6-phosphate deaminase [Clostridiales bacterium]
MKVRIFDSREEVLVASAWEFIKYAANVPGAAIGVCTGTTTEPVHDIVVDIYKKNPFDCTNVHTFNADEYVQPDGYVGVKPSMTPRMLALWNTLGLTGHLPDGAAEDKQAECDKYEAEIREVGGIDLQMLGVGPDAHLGFCLPGTPFGTWTHVTPVSPTITRNVNIRFPDMDPAKYGPFYGITMGLRSFMQGKKTLPITVGSHKAEAVANAILGPVTEAVPASILQLHPNCVWYMDKEAAEGIIGRIDESMLIK